jgi:2-C-methyl-D-erythritol 4-phosphate cytidylyltransferase
MAVHGTDPPVERPGRRNLCAAVILAGGSGSRLRAGDNKAYLPLAGRPIISWSLRTFQDSTAVDRIVVVTRAADVERARELVGRARCTKVVAVVEGGEDRHASEHAGLEALASDIEAGLVGVVCVHDAARPFVDEALLRRVVEAANASGGAVPCLEFGVTTLLRARPDGVATDAVATAALRRAQTPQAFRASELLAAYRQATEAGFSGLDTAESAQRFSTLRVVAVDGDPANVKVTYARDLDAAARAAARR